MCKKRWVNNLEGSGQLEVALNVRRFILAFLIPGVCDMKNVALLNALLYKILNPKPNIADLYIAWMADYPSDLFHDLVVGLQAYVTRLVRSLPHSR